MNLPPYWGFSYCNISQMVVLKTYFSVCVASVLQLVYKSWCVLSLASNEKVLRVSFTITSKGIAKCLAFNSQGLIIECALGTIHNYGHYHNVQRERFL